MNAKSISSRNAITHGLCSDLMLIPGEDPNELHAFSKELFQHFSPENSYELLLTNRVISLAWRLQRAERAERGMFLYRYLLKREVEIQSGLSKCTEVYDPMELAHTIGKPIVHVVDEKGHAIITRKLEKIKKLQDSQETFAGKSFCLDQENFSNLSRYETETERRFYRAVHELEKVQAIRKGQKPITTSDEDEPEADGQMEQMGQENAGSPRFEKKEFEKNED